VTHLAHLVIIAQQIRVVVVRLVVQVNINLVAVPDPPIQFVLLVQVVVQVNKKV
jgi:hypothetical protein